MAKSTSKTAMTDIIVINRMYVGEYGETNLDHEVINVFKSDDDHYYLYLNNKNGKFDKKYKGRIKQMLLVQGTSYSHCAEVIGIANGLTDVSFEKKEQDKLINKVSYGGVTLAQLFSENEEQTNYVTFEAESVCRPEKPTYLAYVECKTWPDDNENNVIHINKNTLREARTGYIEEEDPDYQELHSIPQGTPFPKLDVEGLDKPKEMNFFELCGIDDNENAFSNAFANIFRKYPQMIKDFFASLGHNVDCSSVEVKREVEERIDIYIETPSHIIVIENKVLSDINGRKHGKKEGDSQLAKYYNYVMDKECVKNGTKKPIFIVLAPDHKVLNLLKYEHGDKYTLIIYSILQCFLKKFIGSNKLIDLFLPVVIDAMKKHCQPYYSKLYDITKRRFAERIYKILHSQKGTQVNIVPSVHKQP